MKWNFNQAFFEGGSETVAHKHRIFTTLVEIGAELNDDPTRNGCVITKIPFQQNVLISSGFGKLIEDDKGPQFPRFLKNSTEKATRVLLENLVSAAQSRNTMQEKYSGAVNIQRILELCLGDQLKCNLYSCSGFKEKIDEGIVLVGGTFDSIYENKPTEDLKYHLTFTKNFIGTAFGKVEFESPVTIQKMYDMFRERITYENR